MESVEQLDDRSLRSVGWDEPAIGQPDESRRQIATGESSELTRAHKYLLFLRYLFESDRLDGAGLN